MTDRPVYMHFIFAFISTVGFAIFLKAPKSTLIPSGFIGGIGWSVYYSIVTATDNNIASNFIAAILISLFSEIFARKLKQPAIVFIIPGIILLVPGLGMYNTMLYLVQTNYTDAIAKGSDVLFVAGAISMGVLVVTSLFKTMNLISRKKAAK